MASVVRKVEDALHIHKKGGESDAGNKEFKHYKGPDRHQQENWEHLGQAALAAQVRQREAGHDENVDKKPEAGVEGASPAAKDLHAPPGQLITGGGSTAGVARPADGTGLTQPVVGNAAATPIAKPAAPAGTANTDNVAAVAASNTTA